MRQTRLYLPETMSVGDVVTLDERCKHHCATVLRAKQGDTVYLFNGNGADYHAKLTTVTRKTVAAEITASIEKSTESPLATHLGQCISASQRFDLAIQKATELGVSAITPLISERAHSLNKMQYEKKWQHWQQVAIHACEQSHRSQLPTIHPITPLAQWLTEQQSDVKWVLSISTKQVLPEMASVKSVACLVGPEGGLTAEEESLACNHGFSAVQLGQRILRTETAPVAALTLAQHYWGDFQ